MVDGATAQPLQDLADVLFPMVIVGVILFGWLNNRGRPHHWDGGPAEGATADDDAPHHGGWADHAGHDGGHSGDAGDSGDGGH